MTTKLIAAIIIIAVLWGGWEVFLYWEKVKKEEENQENRAKASVVVPQNLPGLPWNLEASLEAAQRQGAAGLRTWLKNNGLNVQDPRKAWIELDFVVLVSREDIREARRVFADVKKRTPANSPVYPRIKQLEKTYE